MTNRCARTCRFPGFHTAPLGLMSFGRQGRSNASASHACPPQLQDPDQHRVLHWVRFEVDAFSSEDEPEGHGAPRLLTLGLLDPEGRLGAGGNHPPLQPCCSIHDRGLQTFFDSTSWRICLSRLRSATSCFSRVFSSRNWRRSRSSETPRFW